MSALALMSATQARANPLDAFGFGARASALGSAYSAVAQDSAANYYNPAGLARSDALRIDLGYQFARPYVEVSGQPQPLLDTRGLQAGVLLPGTLMGVRFAFGVGLFLPDQHVTRIRVLSVDMPRLHMYDNRTQRLHLSANVAVQVYRGLYVGGGLTFMSRSSGTVYLRGRVGISDPERSELTASVEQNLFAIRYPQAGLLWEATRNLSFALVYRHRFALDLEQGFQIDAQVADPGQRPVVEKGTLREVARAADLFQPWQVVAGAAARFGRWQVSFDATFARWSEQPVPAAVFTLDLDIGKLTDLVKLPKSKEYPPVGFRDVLIPAVGVEWKALEGAGPLTLLVRAGYRYEGSPVPSQEGDTSLGDADKHIVSFGLGADLLGFTKVLQKPLSIDGFVGLTSLEKRVFRKADPRSEVGDFTVSGLVVQTGLSARFAF
jgi:long-chain fatty acid transport protein